MLFSILIEFLEGGSGLELFRHALTTNVTFPHIRSVASSNCSMDCTMRNFRRGSDMSLHNRAKRGRCFAVKFRTVNVETHLFLNIYEYTYDSDTQKDKDTFIVMLN